MSSLHAAAVRYAGHGWPVLPCRPGLKIPQTANGLKDATVDREVIDRWWAKTPEANVAVVTGARSGLVVLDVDGDDGAESLRRLERDHQPLPPTTSVVTPSGGAHYYFAHFTVEVRNSAGRLGLGLDVRADGGYVLLPPSVVASGRYEVDERRAPAPMPEWLLQLTAANNQQASRAAASEWIAIVRDGVRGPDPWSGTASEGRNDKLTRLVGHLLRRYVDVGLVLEIAHLVNESRFRPPLLRGDVECIVDSIAGKELARRQASHPTAQLRQAGVAS